MEREKRSELLRWIGVLPAAILGGIVAQYFGGLLGRFAIDSWGPRSESTMTFAIQLVAYAIAAAGFVLAGAVAAPRSRRMTALVLGFFGILLSLLKHVLMQSHPGIVNYLHLTAETAGTALTVVYMFYADNAQGRDETPRDDETR